MVCTHVHVHMYNNRVGDGDFIESVEVGVSSCSGTGTWQMLNGG